MEHGEKRDPLRFPLQKNRYAYNIVKKTRVFSDYIPVYKNFNVFSLGKLSQIHKKIIGQIVEKNLYI